MIRKKGFDWHKYQERYASLLLSKFGSKIPMHVSLSNRCHEPLIKDANLKWQLMILQANDSNGDVLMPGAINWDQSDKYLGMARSIPTKFEIDFNPNPVNWLSKIVEKHGIKSELLKLDELMTTYQPITEQQNMNLNKIYIVYEWDTRDYYTHIHTNKMAFTKKLEAEAFAIDLNSRSDSLNLEYLIDEIDFT